ncbi:MAG: DEAD/DEAH box helicase [Lutibacter sp.]
MSTFQDLNLPKPIQKALTDLGYVNPTPIQQIAIPKILNTSTDLKAFAQTGTGKTAAFSLPILTNIDTNNSEIQAIILSPTRELAIQIANNIQEFSKYIDVKTLAVYGGANIDEQIKKLKKGVQIVVGTPGRTVDLINRKRLNLSQINWLVLDEADEMLNMGFKDELDKILATTPSNKQTLLFSATFPKEVEQIAKNYMHNPSEISAGEKNKGADKVTHQSYVVSERYRYATLKRIADLNPNIYSIVFCRTRRETQEIADKLIKDGYNADSLHGDLSQNQRDAVMNKFREKHLQLLIATDVAARGLDVNDLTHVINYKLPDQIESYTHRSGRTGRAGKEGISIAIVNLREKSKLRAIERKIGKQFIATPIPKKEEICHVQLMHLMDKIKDIDINEGEIANFLPAIYSKLENLTREELIKRFVSIEFNSFLNYYKNAPDLNTISQKESSRNKKDIEMSRFFINIGKKDHLNPARLIGLINDQKIASNIEIGQIEILNSFSFFEIEKEYENETISAFENNHNEFEGRIVNVELTKTQKSRKKNKSKRSKTSNFRQDKKDFSQFGRKRNKNKSTNFQSKRKKRR